MYTPSCKEAIRHATRKSYHALATGMSSSGISNATVISKVAQKIKSEMKDLASVTHDSMLRNSDSAVKNFLWEIELAEKVCRLMSLLLQLISKPTKSKPLLCMLASMILKSRHPHVGLAQRVMSVMLYGNSIAKQVN